MLNNFINLKNIAIKLKKKTPPHTFMQQRPNVIKKSSYALP